MDIVLDVVAFIKGVFANKIIRKYSEEFANRALAWLRPSMSAKDPQLVLDLENNASENYGNTRLTATVNELLQHPEFKKGIKAYMEQSSQYMITHNAISNNIAESGKNIVVEIENQIENGSKNNIENNDLKSSEDIILRIKNTGI